MYISGLAFIAFLLTVAAIVVLGGYLLAARYRAAPLGRRALSPAPNPTPGPQRNGAPAPATRAGRGPRRPQVIAR